MSSINSLRQSLRLDRLLVETTGQQHQITLPVCHRLEQSLDRVKGHHRATPAAIPGCIACLHGAGKHPDSSAGKVGDAPAERVPGLVIGHSVHGRVSGSRNPSSPAAPRSS